MAISQRTCGRCVAAASSALLAIRCDDDGKNGTAVSEAVREAANNAAAEKPSTAETLE